MIKSTQVENKIISRTHLSRSQLADDYLSVRAKTEEMCQHLEREDFVVQPCPEVSPPKWHLGHTTWFFEELILVQYAKNFSRFNEGYRQVFNSYYKSAGSHWLQDHRGDLSRPTVNEVFEYRAYVDQSIQNLLNTTAKNESLDFLLEVGLHHEQQHQELLLMDIKYILASNPSLPAYIESSQKPCVEPAKTWKTFNEGVYEVGHGERCFAYDNEGPRHKVYLQPFAMRDSVVTNGEYLQFIEDKGYETAKWWLSDGWDFLTKKNHTKPLYWRQSEGQWFEYTLHGLQPLDLNAPLTHINYYEADAFANWAGVRLPTEFEFEIYLEGVNPLQSTGVFHPNDPNLACGQVWCWTRSHYSPYPGYKPYEGMIGEYNGKFMCNQFVLRGGCVATPRGHYRHTYRNFYQPQQNWMFSGLRLAKDL